MRTSPTLSARERLLEKRAEFLMPCTRTFFAEPLWIERAQGVHVYDEKGRDYLDFFSGVGVVNLGHGRREVVEAACESALHLDHTTTIYVTEPMILLAERLAELTPGSLKRSFFCSSGSEANETAALVAHLRTSRSRFIAFDRGLHGRTLLTMNLTGLPMWRTDPSLSDRVLHVPTPYCHRCPLKRTFPSCELACAKEAAGMIEQSGAESFASMIAEPVLGNGGIIVPPEGYFEVLEETLRKHGILFIADELQTGFGRTGRWFGSEHHGLEPHLLSLGKALGNGVPIGVAMATDDAGAAYSRPGASTFGGNGFSVGAARAVLELMTELELPARAARMGEALEAGLRELALRHRCVGEVRGLGLMLGMEIEDADGREDPVRTDFILEGMRERGFLPGKTGRERNVLTFMPPLVIESGEIEALLEALDEVLREAEVLR